MTRKPIAPSIAQALADRAGPASDYTSPPQPLRSARSAWVPDPGLPSPRAKYCTASGCPIAPDCAETCYLLET